MRTFWAKGYESTSTRDLCEALGLDRSSLYNAFTNKCGLFKRALTRYMDVTTANQLRILDNHEVPATERIRALFDEILQVERENRRNGYGLGCLTVNTTTELSGRDQEIALMLDRNTEQRVAGLSAVIAIGQRDGDIGSVRDATELARFINAVIAGIRVAAQGGEDDDAIAAIAATAMDVLA
ncbi:MULTISPECIES: TetR/AcrR family transcriptional regulator [unclassified Streptomyces]|uniref:TetR/AcrR family transcriptional regulator n=1 Tax=unclassified Streptomyces TaxID=2593676 RepID=UPI0021D4782A|nr:MULTISPECIES: TetR/AcrR family transcriptional regulator [unclassified Streptomyces]